MTREDREPDVDDRIDIAASALILREAGGEIVDLEGKVLDMPFDLVARSNFLAYGDPRAKEVLL